MVCWEQRQPTYATTVAPEESAGSQLCCWAQHPALDYTPTVEWLQPSILKQNLRISKGLWCLKKMLCKLRHILPKQCLIALRGSHGVGVEGAMAGVRIRPWTRPLIFLLFTILGDTYPQGPHLLCETHNKSNTFKEL